MSQAQWAGVDLAIDARLPVPDQTRADRSGEALVGLWGLVDHAVDLVPCDARPHEASSGVQNLRFWSCEASCFSAGGGPAPPPAPPDPACRLSAWSRAPCPPTREPASGRGHLFELQFAVLSGSYTHNVCVYIYIYIYSGFRIESGHRVRYCREPSTRGRYAGSSHSQAIASVASQSASQKVQRQGHHPQGSAAAAAPSEKGTTTAYQPPQPAPLPVPRDLRHGCQEAKLGKGRWLATRMGNPGEGLAQGPSSRAMCRLPPLRAVYQCLAGPDYSADGGEQGRTDLSPEHRAEERHRGPQSRGQAAEDCSMEETGGSQMAELPGAAEGGVRRRTTPIPRGHQKSWKRTWWSSRANNKRP